MRTFVRINGHYIYSTKDDVSLSDLKKQFKLELKSAITYTIFRIENKVRTVLDAKYKRKTKCIDVKTGEEYPSLTACALALGLDLSTVYYRMNRNKLKTIKRA